MSQAPVPSYERADWSNFSALSWNLEMRLSISNCIDALYRIDPDGTLTGDESSLLGRVAGTLSRHDSESDTAPVEQIMVDVMVMNTARGAFGSGTDGGRATLDGVAERLRTIAHAGCADTGVIDGVAADLVQIHTTLFDTGYAAPVETVELDRFS